MVGAPACGDVMRLQIKVGDDGIITDAKFKTYGCGSAIASSSLVTEMVKGMMPKNALNRRSLLRLKVYIGSEHPHESQQPQPLNI